MQQYTGKDEKLSTFLCLEVIEFEISHRLFFYYFDCPILQRLAFVAFSQLQEQPLRRLPRHARPLTASQRTSERHWKFLHC